MNYSKITISGPVCTGKSTLFHRLEKHLHWKTFSTSSYFREYAKKHDIDLESADEQSETVTKAIDFTVKKMLEGPEHLIVEGWMAGLMAEDRTDVLRILLICDDTVRIQRYCMREDTDPENAYDDITDRERNLFGKLSKIYQRNDFLDENKYNLVIDTTDLTEDEVFDRVLTELE